MMYYNDMSEYISNLQTKSARARAKQAGIQARRERQMELTSLAADMAVNQMRMVFMSGLNPRLYLPEDE